MPMESDEKTDRLIRELSFTTILFSFPVDTLINIADAIIMNKVINSSIYHKCWYLNKYS